VIEYTALFNTEPLLDAVICGTVLPSIAAVVRCNLLIPMCFIIVLFGAEHDMQNDSVYL
jgi:hypothetical protein